MNINQIQAMKGTGEKSAALVVWDAPTAHIAHECGADFLIVGDSVGVNLWGHAVTGDGTRVVCDLEMMAV